MGWGCSQEFITSQISWCMCEGSEAGLMGASVPLCDVSVSSCGPGERVASLIGLIRSEHFICVDKLTISLCNGLCWTDV